MSKTAKSPQESAVIMRELIMPQHANPQNTIFGGVVMSWVDIAAAMCASRHTESQVVTVHVDELTFEAPVKVGMQLILKASVNYVGNTSMEVGVRVESHNPLTGETRLTTKAYLTMVAVDEFGKPKKVIPLKPASEIEKKRHKNAEKRSASRKALKQSLKED